MSVTINLIDGFKVGEQTHMTATLRAPTTKDLIECQEAAEKMVQTEQGPELLISPSVMGTAMLARQITRVGDHDGPLTLAELKRFSVTDFALLQRAADELDAALNKKASEAVTKRGRSNQGGKSTG